MVRLEIEASNGHTLFTTLLRLDATFAMTPQATSSSRRVLRPQTQKLSWRWFWGPNHQTVRRSVSIMPPLLSQHVSLSSSIARSPSPPAPLLDFLNRCLDLVNMINTCALACWCSQVSATTISLPAILVPRSKPHVRPSPLQVHRHSTSLLDLLHVRRSSPCFTPAHQHSQETCCTHTHAMVSLKTQPKPIIFDNHSSQTWHTRAHINLVFAISPLMSVLSTPTHRDGSKTKIKRYNSLKWPKAKEKPKRGHLKWAKLGLQRHGQRLDATKQSIASPQEEAEWAQHR
jgi:hypothetical protein